MLRTILLSIATIALLAVGLIGLVVPIFPGVLLLIAAASCASAASPTVRNFLKRSPTMRRAHRRWRASQGLAWFDRIKLVFWLGADAMLGAAPEMRRPR